MQRYIITTAGTCHGQVYEMRIYVLSRKKSQHLKIVQRSESHTFVTLTIHRYKITTAGTCHGQVNEMRIYVISRKKSQHLKIVQRPECHTFVTLAMQRYATTFHALTEVNT